MAAFNKLKIAVVAACPFPVPRGTPIRILRLSEALAARGHEVHIAAYHLGSGPVANGVRVHRIADIPSYRRLGPGPTYRKVLRVDPALTQLLRRLLRVHSFDIVHAHHYEGLLVGAAARVGRRVPLVFDAHSLVESELPYFKLGLPAPVKVVLGRCLDYSLPRLAEHTVCVTDVIRDTLVAKMHLDPARVSVVMNGIELDHFDPARVPTKPAGGKTVIFTGNLARYQGIDLMLEAFRHVVTRIPDARLVIATDSSFDPYESLARELGIRDRIEVVPAPRFEDLPRLLATADVTVNPRTDCVGMPVKLLNYMAAARPVASYDSSAPGVVHRKTGWLAKSGDVEALGNAIVVLLANPARARAIGWAAREYVRESCSWPRAAKKCEEIYGSLLLRRQPDRRVLPRYSRSAGRIDRRSGTERRNIP